jgi:methionyl-tRNA formyltransferase
VRTLLLANNGLGASVGRYLRERDELIGLIVHPPERRGAADELAALDVPTWTWPADLEVVATLAPECLLSVLFGYLLPREWLELPTWGAVNLHPSLLPFNRGANPNVWPLVDHTPAGTTLHVMSPEIDGGAVIAQREVPVHPDDTAYSLHQRLHAASYELVCDTWPSMPTITPRTQEGTGSSHRVADLQLLDLGPEDFATLDKLRARHFPPYGAQFERDGKRYQIAISIEPVDHRSP